MRARSSLAFLCAAGALAVPAAAQRPHPPGPNERAAVDAINRARRAVTAHDKACGFRLVLPSTPTTHDPPPQAFLDALGVLRRPAAPGDALGIERGLFPGFAGGVNVDFIRRARVLPDGTQVFVIPALDARPRPRLTPKRCDRAELALVRSSLRGRPKALRRALQIDARILAYLRKAMTAPPQPGLFVLTRGRHGGGGGGAAGLDVLRKTGVFGTEGSGRRRRSRLVGLVPDGVARIDFTFGRSSPFPGSRPYPRALRLSHPVVANVVTFHVDRAAQDAFPRREVWRAADGSVVNVVKRPF